MSNQVAAFDAVAATYDDTFATTRLGEILRERTRVRLRQFTTGMRVLELGCGTGEDAVWLAQRGVNVTATDASPAMLEQTRAKAKRAGVSERIKTELLDLNDPSPNGPRVGTGPELEQLDGVFSNFGPLNCVRDLRPLAERLAIQLRSGGRVILVIMGPVCPWEVAIYARRRDWKNATRRFNREGAVANIGGNPLLVFYPSARKVARVFAPHFRRAHLEALGVLLPPPYLEHFAARHPHLIDSFANWESRIASFFPFNALGDHYLLELVKKG